MRLNAATLKTAYNIYKAMSTRDNREQSRDGPLDARSRHIASRLRELRLLRGIVF